MKKINLLPRNHHNGVSLKNVFRNESGAIDLSSIMVGIIVIGIIVGIIAATVIALIPWAQDNAAKQQLDSITAAESSYFGLSAATPTPLPTGTKSNSFGASSDLATANLLPTGTKYCVSVSVDGKNYTAYSHSASGSTWSITDTNTKPSLVTGPLPAECAFIDPYVDPTPTRTVMTYNCDVATTGEIPLSVNLTGTETWNDGVTHTYSNTAAVSRTFAAGTTYTMTFDGTYGTFNGNTTTNSSNLSKCLRSVDHWGMNTGVVVAYGAFFGASNLTSVPAHIPATITNMSLMFNSATTFNDSNISLWDTSNVTSMSQMFQSATAFNQPLNGWNVSRVTTMNCLFSGTKFNQPLDKWNTSKVTDMSAMFQSNSAFNQNIGGWDTSNVTNMHAMFGITTAFNQPINSWNTSKVTNMSQLFYYASNFNQPLNSWNTSNVTNMSQMFYNATTFNQPITTWNTSKVTDLSYMFAYVNAFNQPLNNWDTSNVGNMSAMFMSDPVFNQDLNTWNTSKVTDMSRMFYGTRAFNKPLNVWDTSKVANMNFMFGQDIYFSQDLSGWNTVAVTNGTSFVVTTFPDSYMPANTSK